MADDTQQELSPQEMRVLRLLAKGRTREGMAADMGIGLGSVKDAIDRVYRKLDALNGANAVDIAWRRGLLGVEVSAVGGDGRA